MSLHKYERDLTACVKRGLYTREELRQERDSFLNQIRDNTKEYSKLYRDQILLHFINLFSRLERKTIDVSML